MYDSENLGSDNESENGTDVAHGDFVDIAELTGQDPALVVETKKIVQ